MVTELKETEEVMRPLRSELQGLEERIREYQASIVAVKVCSCAPPPSVPSSLDAVRVRSQSSIFRNESRIGELLKLVVTK